MEEIQEIKNTIENIMDEIDEGLVQINTIYLEPSILDNDNNNFNAENNCK